MADLHALMLAAGLPGPYVLAGHSLGGFFVRLYAGTYPDEVAGLVPVDAGPDGILEQIEPLLTPDQWGALLWLLISPIDLAAARQAGLEAYDTAALPDVMRQEMAATPLRAMPPAVLAHGRPFSVTEAVLGYPPSALEAAFRIAQEQLATLLPNAHLFVAGESGHDIQEDQPALVTEAIRQVVTGVHNPDS